MLYLAQSLGIPIDEVAVEWNEIEGLFNIKYDLKFSAIIYLKCIVLCCKGANPKKVGLPALATSTVWWIKPWPPKYTGLGLEKSTFERQADFHDITKLPHNIKEN